MTIDFICGVLAELFESPCNFSPMDEYMLQDEYCEHHCGKVADKDCWKRYFEKRWADRKTESNSEKPNNSTISKMEQVDEPQTVETMSCQECKHFNENAVMYLDQCEFCFKECHYEPKDEPQTDNPCKTCETYWNCQGQCDEIPQIEDKWPEERSE